MKIVSVTEVPLQEVTYEDTQNCRIQWLICPADGAPNFAMRRFVLGRGGCTPRHSHPWEHEVYVLAGRGRVYVEGKEYQLQAGTVVFVAPGEEHQFMAAGEEGIEFLCLVPNGPATQR